MAGFNWKVQGSVFDFSSHLLGAVMKRSLWKCCGLHMVSTLLAKRRPQCRNLQVLVKELSAVAPKVVPIKAGPVHGIQFKRSEVGHGTARDRDFQWILTNLL